MRADGPIGVTIGDPAGIGPEIVARLFGQDLPWPAVAIGDAGALRRAVRLNGTELQVTPIDADAMPTTHRRGALPILVTSDIGADLAWGRVDARAGLAAYKAVVTAASLARQGRLSAMVTAPLHKAALAAAGIAHPGHTEILAEVAGGVPVSMMLANRELRVILVSIHVALREALAAVTIDNELAAIRGAQTACRSLGIARPRIAVAGLNPHAGEGGLMGREEIEIIAPAIERARAAGIDATGPYPPDTIFMRARRGEFDIVVAQYHDQGLIPVKYLGLDEGVNVTIGLPFIRTSVDHGTAFDIAGKGIASAASLRHAFDLAVRLAALRAGPCV